MSEYDHLLATCPRDMQLGKCPKGFKVQMIKISHAVRGGGTRMCDVLAFVHEGLAIHKCPWGWHITHIKSGKKLVYMPNTKREAVKAVKTLAGLVNWHLAESTLRKRKDECDMAIGKVRDA